jgi:hypothetical protein
VDSKSYVSPIRVAVADKAGIEAAAAKHGVSWLSCPQLAHAGKGLERLSNVQDCEFHKPQGTARAVTNQFGLPQCAQDAHTLPHSRNVAELYINPVQSVSVSSEYRELACAPIRPVCLVHGADAV